MSTLIGYPSPATKPTVTEVGHVRWSAVLNNRTTFCRSCLDSQAGSADLEHHRHHDWMYTSFSRVDEVYVYNFDLSLGMKYAPCNYRDSIHILGGVPEVNATKSAPGFGDMG